MFAGLENTMGRVAERLSTNKVLIAIRDGFLVGTPLIIVASIFLVIANFPVPGYSDFMRNSSARVGKTQWMPLLTLHLVF